MTEVPALPSYVSGVAAIDASLIGGYYERFADHAVAIARQVCYLGRLLVGH